MKEDYIPYMLGEEIRFLDNFFTKEKIVFEWGAGYSTLRWADSVKFWYTVEHDIGWFTKISNLMDRNKTEIYHIPQENKEYIEKPKFIKNKINVFLIDGVRRLECRDIAMELMEEGDNLLVHDSIRHKPSNLMPHIDITKGLVQGNHKGLRLYIKTPII